MSDLGNPGLMTRTFVVEESCAWPYGGATFYGNATDGSSERVHAIAFKDLFPSGARIPLSGEIYTVTGRLHPNPLSLRPPYPRLPKQLHLVHCELVPPKGTMLFYFLRYGRPFRHLGIGETKWSRLEDYFRRCPEDLLEALSRADIGPLVDNSLWSAEVAGRLMEAWRSVDQYELEVIAYLQSKGFSGRLGERLRQVWGTNVKTYLEANPYYLVAHERWSIVDDIATRLFHIALNDPRRLVGAVLACVYHRLVVGKHTLTRHDPLVQMVRARLRVDDDRLAEEAIERACRKGVIVGSKEAGWQPDGAAEMERRVKTWIEDIASGAVFRRHGFLLPNLNPAYINSMIARHEAVESRRLGKAFKLNTEQRQAVFMALTNPLSIICGGAGCGKTTVLKIILEILNDTHQPFYQMALAGRAARRMNELTGEEASTITRFLNWLGSGQADLDRCPYIIIDEASMLDLPTTEHILRYIHHGGRLLFVGDQHQLAPIQFGLVFHKLVEARNPDIKKTELVRIERQDDSTGIPQIAEMIRNQQMPTIKQYQHRTDPGVSHLDCAVEDMNRVLTEIVDELGGEEAVQVISIRHDHPGGVDEVNRAFQDWLDRRCMDSTGAWRPQLALSLTDPNARFARGDKVIYLENDAARDLYNGTLGMVLEVLSDGVRCEFEGVDHPVDISGDELHKLQAAFSVTCHKAQGSQFRRVVIAVVDSLNLLDRNLIYTALTRGVEQVVFVGNLQLIENAIHKSFVEMREVGLYF